MSRLARGLPFVLVVCLFIAIPATLAKTADPPPADDRPWPSPLLPLVEPPPSPAPRAAAMTELPWSRLVYYAYGQRNWDIYYSDDGGQQTVRLTTSKTIEVEPDLNRGGTHVVYVSDQDGDFDIYLMRVSDQAKVRILDTPADEHTPVLSPDGRIAFQSDMDGQPEIYVMGANGSGLTRLTNNPDFDGLPSWSPDSRLAFSSRRNGQYRIWVMNADGSGQTQLSSQPGSLYPAWSPAGGQIAYSADGDSDGWLDLWLMNADGTQQQELRRSRATFDTMPRSWAPGASHLALTEAHYVYYEGLWLIENTDILKMTMDSGLRTEEISAPAYPFAPAWATLDTEAPVTAIAPLPAVSSHPFRVSWQAGDLGLAGIARHEVQVAVDGGPWQTWLDNAAHVAGSDYIAGAGGHTYAFRSRAIDRALNVEPWPAAAEATTTVEALPPQTWLSPLPVFLRSDQSYRLTRDGFDPGGSGIQSYELEQRLASAPWAAYTGEWTENQTVIEPAQPGDTVAYRLRATDNAHNVEPWPAEPGDARTTYYSWATAGRVTDNAGAPVYGAAVTTSPAALGAPTTGSEGEYARYLLAAVPATLDWAKSGYGDLPATTLLTTLDILLDVALPPAGDVVLGGDFEDADWGTWQPGGTISPTLSVAAAHTGVQGALLAPAAARFGPPYRLSNTSVDIEEGVRLHLHRGAATVTWLSGDGAHFELKWARRGPDGAWTPPATLAAAAWGGYDLVAGSDGLLHVVATSESGLIYRRQIGPTTWAAPEAVPASLPSQEPRLLRGPDGALHLLWVEYDDRVINLRYSRRAPAGGWSAPVVAAALPEAVLGGYGAALTPGGALLLGYLEWNDEDDIGDRLWTRERRPNGQWTEPMLLQQTENERLAIRWDGNLVVGSDGRAHMLWSRMHHFISYIRNDTYYAVGGGGASWSAARRIFIDGEAAALAVGPDGAPHALLSLWGEYGYTTQRDGMWLPLERVAGTTAGWTNLLIDGDGQPHVLRAGHDGTYSAGNLQYTRRLPSGAWTAAEPVATLFNNNYRSEAALDAGGNVHVAWLVEDHQTYQTRPDLVYAGPPAAAAARVTTLAQTVATPTADHPVLSFFYGFGRAMLGTRLELIIGDDPPINLPVAGAEPGRAGRHRWFDLSERAGQPVTITFRLVQATGQPLAWAAVDDVSLGAAHGDVWIGGWDGAALPGEMVVQSLVVGNRGGVDAVPGVTLTYTLPPELRFVAADPAPVAKDPMRWELGALPPGATTTIQVTVAVDDAARLFSTLVGSAAVELPGELETENNAAEMVVRVERRAYGPVVMGK